MRGNTLWVLAHPDAGSLSGRLRDAGVSGSIDDVLWPLLHGTLWYTGMQPLRPHLVAEADSVDATRANRLARCLADRLARIDGEEPIDYLPLDDEFYDHSIRLHDDVSPGLEGIAAHRRCGV